MGDDKKYLILIADDDNDFRSIMSMKLQSAGFEVIGVNDGIEVLPKMEEVTPDLVILDLQMPLQNGFDTYLQIKENPNFSNMKIVFLTNYGDPKSESSQIAENNPQGMHYIKKTDDLDKIIEDIRQIING